MKRILLLPLLVVLTVGCRHRQQETVPSAMQQVASFRLDENTELHLLTDSNLSQVELYYGGELQELAGTANTLFVTDSSNLIKLDTVHLDDGPSTQYIIRTYDRSSTYGAEVWYIAYPLYDGEEGNGPWALVRLPFDCPAIEDTDGDGHMEILGHSPKEPNYHVYSFSHGLLNHRHSLCTWEECHVAN